MPEALLLRGGAALTDFRRARLLSELQSVDSSVVELSAGHIHVVLSDTPLWVAPGAGVAALLDDGLPELELPQGST
ncbi:MAG: hypothetical protein ACK44L_13855, partial [Burkholderiales bacterium]